MAKLVPIKYRRNTLEILDQLMLPHEVVYIPIRSPEDAWAAINNMQTRGAPAIAVVAALSLAVELQTVTIYTKKDLLDYVMDRWNFLISARPTAVNITSASIATEMLGKKLISDDSVDTFDMKMRITEALEDMLNKDVTDNKAIGEHGARYILDKHEQPIRILTHCNTGTLATAGYGTALGVVRSLHERDCLEQVYCTETRPYNQGSRLTAFELVYEKIPATLICDNMAAALMKSKELTAVVVGADRVAANGDTANKIGTYQLAILARYHGVPFYVAAPWTTIDLNAPNGLNIPIEERSAEEITHIMNIPIAAPGINCWNPVFDVTPAEMITAFITETGVYPPSALRGKKEEIEETGGQGDF